MVNGLPVQMFGRRSDLVLASWYPPVKKDDGRHDGTPLLRMMDDQ